MKDIPCLCRIIQILLYDTRFQHNCVNGDVRMKLFDIIPDKFFNILSSTNKETYSDCLFILYSELKNNTSFGIDREIVIQTLVDYFEGIVDKNLFYEEEETVKTSRDKANLIIRRLYECGWIDLETTTSYKQIVNFTDFSIPFLDTMEKLINNEKLEYQGYVYAIYSILFGNENIQYNVMLEQISDNTNRLMTGLKTLNSNIKKYIERITVQKSPEEIMKLHFEGYTQDIIDKGYHRLKTSDNVSKFRPKIIEKLENFKRDREFMDSVCKQNIEMEKQTNFDGAYEDAMNKLNAIVYAFENMDIIINEIDRKNSQYIRASLTRVKYLLNSSRDLSGQVNEIFKYVVAIIEKDNLDIKEDYIEDIEKLFEVFSQGFVDEKSIYSTSEGKAAFVPQSIDNKNNLSRTEREAKIKEIREINKNRMSRENVDKFVMDILKDKNVVNASFIPILEVKDYIKIIYILIYSKSRIVKYRVNRLNNVIETGDFTFNDFEIWRK